jgi:hypothetical protein
MKEILSIQPVHEEQKGESYAEVMRKHTQNEARLKREAQLR